MFTRLLTIPLIFLGLQALAFQTEPIITDSIPDEPVKSKIINIDFLVRSGFYVTDFTSSERSTKFNLDDARIVIKGDYNEQLSYAIRFRLNSSFAPTSLDNSSNAIDFAYLKYKFGRNNAWSLSAGKQTVAVGSFEYDSNPLYEYAYSEFVSNMFNLFVVGGTLSYDINPQHSFSLQGYNSNNSNFAEHLARNGFSSATLEPSKTPVGGYLTWKGNFYDQKIQTLWSINTNQLAKDKNNYNIALGNKYKTEKQQIYLDLQYSHFALDNAFIASNTINNYYNILDPAERTPSKNISYKSAVVRYDQFLSPKWEVALKGAFETTSARKDEVFGNDFRKSWTYFAALQHKPYQTQDLRIYLAYIGNSIDYSKKLAIRSEQVNRLTLGAYFTIPVL